MAGVNPDNASTLCDHIFWEQNQYNVKDSTKEGKIRVIVWLSAYFDHKKAYTEMSKQDIQAYLNSLRKAEEFDPTHKWISTYNGRQRIFSKFYRWLYNHKDESDSRKWITPPCMKGVRSLPRKEISPYEAGDMWTGEDHSTFLKYCPSRRDKAFHAMMADASARPGEILKLKVGDIRMKLASDGVRQYAEVLVNGKTGQRTLALINSIPYVKDWLIEHPAGNNPQAWLIVSQSRKNSQSRLNRDSLLKKYQDQYKKKFFPRLLEGESVPERDKSHIRNLLTKPWNLYVFRHSALTEKSSPKGAYDVQPRWLDS
jgi:site-specific recombinase XerD